MSIDSTEQQLLATFAEKAYLDYSMYVILDRALPHITDGLKPVQRRIIYAMSELGLSATAKFKKSTRTVGDVLGKFHPHGDSACYEAMVLMAQPFSYRYPLIDGQGNWGSADDPKSFAAMRYTEARLSSYAQTLLSELDQGTVDWGLNFDGTLQEPLSLPARLPNILLNGSTGIAVGMATDIPPHNLKEVVAACIALLKDPSLSVEQLLEYIQGPDFPTEGEIVTPRELIIKAYKTGTGSVKQRAIYQVEDGNIVVTALPAQVSGAKIIEQIAQQMLAKKLPMISDIRDESDHENPTRIVLEPRSNRVDVDSVMNHLFVTTDLERSYRINLNIVGCDNRPQVKDLRTILLEWLSYRLSVVSKRLQYRLDKVNRRLHILSGLLIAHLNIDEVIAIIRHEDDPKQALMARFALTELQTEAILELKLRHLARLEEIKIRTEQDNLTKEQEELVALLGSEEKLKRLVMEELQAVSDQHGDHRRSPLCEREEAQIIKEQEILAVEPITIILSKKGWIRSAKGHGIKADNLNYKAGDSLLMTIQAKTNETLVLFDSTGRSYSLPSHSLPSARGQGEPLTSRLTLPDGAHFIGMVSGSEQQYCLISSSYGYGFLIQLKDLYSKNRAGKQVLNLPHPSARVLPPQLIHSKDEDYIAAATSKGYLLAFSVSQLPCLTKGKGNKIINIPAKLLKAQEEFVVAVSVLSPPNYQLELSSGQQKLKLNLAKLANYQGDRGRRGNKLPRGYQKVDQMQAILGEQ